jgi:hypothetical protein
MRASTSSLERLDHAIDRPSAAEKLSATLPASNKTTHQTPKTRSPLHFIIGHLENEILPTIFHNLSISDLFLYWYKRDFAIQDHPRENHRLARTKYLIIATNEDPRSRHFLNKEQSANPGHYRIVAKMFTGQIHGTTITKVNTGPLIRNGNEKECNAYETRMCRHA